jgi:hypothetical protein
VDLNDLFRLTLVFFYIYIYLKDFELKMLSLLLKTRDQLAMIQNQNHFFQLSCVLHLNKIYTDFKQKKKFVSVWECGCGCFLKCFSC